MAKKAVTDPTSSAWPASAVELVAVTELIPYARNARTHSDEQVAQIMASIREFGFTQPILRDETGLVIAGHGRLTAAQRLGLPEVPVVTARGWSEAKKRACVIADNKLALNAGWDYEMLSLELSDLQDMELDMSLLGFSEGELNNLLNAEWEPPETEDLPGSEDDDDDHGLSERYSREIKAPIYTPKGVKPDESELFDRTKAEALIAEIDATELPPPVADFLRHAAERHTVFRFDRIAEYYAHAPATVQALMEQSALVIIDFEQAVEYGYVRLTEKMLEQAGISKARHGRHGEEDNDDA